jgi:CHASE3 domain sensor protein
MKNWTEKSWGLLVMMIVSLMIMVHVSCSTTNKTITHGCDLMKEGKRCLPDHSCCK